MTDAAIDSRPSTTRPKRHDHSMFEAELSGNVLNLHLLGRIMHWLKPYRLGLFVSAFFVLAASVLAVLMEIVISLVLVDYIIIGQSDGNMPDLGMIELTQWIEHSLGIPALFSAGIVFFVAMTVLI